LYFSFSCFFLLLQANTVDEVISEHDRFLDKCLKETLLTNPQLFKVCLLDGESERQQESRFVLEILIVAIHTTFFFLLLTSQCLTHIMSTCQSFAENVTRIFETATLNQDDLFVGGAAPGVKGQPNAARRRQARVKVWQEKRCTRL
jgi:hypothetical protein